MQEIERRAREMIDKGSTGEELDRLAQEFLRGQGEEIERGLLRDVLVSMVPVRLSGPKYVDFPVFEGKEWTELQQVLPGVGLQLAWMPTRSRVSGIEEAETEAGTFRSFRIVRSIYEPHMGRYYSALYRYSYSPDTKSIVRYYFLSTTTAAERVIELIKFGSAN